MRIGLGEIVVLVFVVVLVFSASRMGQLGNALGKFVYSFKKASKGEDFVDVGPSKQRISKRAGKSQTEDAQIIDGDRPSR
jgi:sec-independent protein translocase protein TatA